MKTANSTRLVYWTTTSLIFVWEGLLPALTSHTPLAVEGIRHLGYPDYFRVLLTGFKVAGALALVLPLVKGRVKEWAYAGFAFTLISALVSHWAVDGFTAQTLFPLLVLAILVASYLSYHQLAPGAVPDKASLDKESLTPRAFTQKPNVLSSLSR